jgi:hypothetical protein
MEKNIFIIPMNMRIVPSYCRNDQFSLIINSGEVDTLCLQSPSVNSPVSNNHRKEIIGMITWDYILIGKIAKLPKYWFSLYTTKYYNRIWYWRFVIDISTHPLNHNCERRNLRLKFWSWRTGRGLVNPTNTSSLKKTFVCFLFSVKVLAYLNVICPIMKYMINGQICCPLYYHTTNMQFEILTLLIHQG